MSGSEVDIPFDVLSHEHGLRLDVFLTRRVRRMSRSLAARIIRLRRVRCVAEAGEHRDAGLLLKPSTRVFEGDRVIMKRRKLPEGPTDGIVVPTVYEDEDLLAVSKPGDLVVHPTASAYNRTLIRILRARFGDERLDLAHRIDKETSGLVLVARHMAASSALATQFAERSVEKSYLAIVLGNPTRTRFLVDVPLRLVPGSESGVMMEVGGAGAYPAETEVEVLSQGNRAALVRVHPKTGRQHQIRVHLLHAGHPILGDKLYLGGEAFFLKAAGARLDPQEIVGAVGHSRQALHAWGARFCHPTRGEPLHLFAPPPPDFVALGRRYGLREAVSPALGPPGECP